MLGTLQDAAEESSRIPYFPEKRFFGEEMRAENDVT
jgi:hypothetical protein